jgi:hypothetical protein
MGVFNENYYPKSLIFKPGVKLKLVHFDPELLILDQKIGGGGGLRGYFSFSKEQNLMKKTRITKLILTPFFGSF